MSSSSLRLKIVPPKEMPAFVRRQRLIDYFEHANARVVLLEAPRGYGKTGVLAQWRKAALLGGSCVVWFDLAASDTGNSVFAGMSLAMEMAAGLGPQEVLDDLLLECAAMNREVLFFFDGFDRLVDRSALEFFQTFIDKAPRSCRIFIASRPIRQRRWVHELMMSGEAAVLQQNELAFNLEEARQLLEFRHVGKIEEDTLKALHHLTDGWPAGLSMVLEKILLAPMQHLDLSAASTLCRCISTVLIDSAFDTLPQAEKSFVMTLSILESFDVDLCQATTLAPDAREVLESILEKSPLLRETERAGWFRVHRLVQEAIRTRAYATSRGAVEEEHRRAACWYATHENWEAAVRHAFEGGDTLLGMTSIRQGLLPVLRAGKLDTVGDWIERISSEDMHRPMDLRLLIARVLATTTGASKAIELTQDLLLDERPHVRYEAAYVCAKAAFHLDDPDLARQYFKQWRHVAAFEDLAMQRTMENVRHWLSEFSPVRHLRPECNVRPVSCSMAGSLAFVEVVALHLNGLSHLREGQPRLVQELLLPALQQIEARLGHRNKLAVLLAVTLASAAIELDDFETAEMLLAKRLDPIELSVLPSGAAMGYLCAFALASHQKDEARALSILEAFRLQSSVLGLCRNEAMAIGGLIKFHCRGGRRATCESLLNELRALEQRSHTKVSMLYPDIRLELLVSSARFHMHWGETIQAHKEIRLASRLARSMGRKRMELEALLMLKEGRSNHRSAEFGDALSAAHMLGLHRLLQESGLWETSADSEVGLPVAAFQREGHHSVGTDGRKVTVRAALTSFLTSREADIFSLLAQGMTNKEIALQLEIGEGTIKWHLKNLYAKLEVSSRKGAVGKVKMMGLMQ